ncbi:MAG: hypothetical protein KKA56_11610 [Gammaproteobacteria bacterium]|jgi:hypothetical protein|nr:hypothetical protein [Gammaproteobacteria bacterium]
MFKRIVIIIQSILIVLLSLKLYSNPNEKEPPNIVSDHQQVHSDPGVVDQIPLVTADFCAAPIQEAVSTANKTDMTEELTEKNTDGANPKNTPTEQAGTSAKVAISGNATLDFSEQEFDYQWAPEFTTRLESIFHQSERLNSLKVKDIECRASLCKINVLSDGLQSLELGVSIGMALEEAGLADNAYQFATKSDNGVFTIFVGRTKDSIRAKD